jgi:hypothetical protein
MITDQPGMINGINSISRNSFALFLCLLYPLLVAVGMLHHQMWRDELEWFLRVKYQPIIAGGDPLYIVYNAFLYLFALIQPSEAMYQLAHLLLIFGGVAVVAFSSPFSNIEKFLIIFGYYFAYEYGVICRYYGFIILFIFLICWLMGREKPNYIIIALMLVVLADHNPSATVMAASLSLYLVLDVYNRILLKKASFTDKSIIWGGSVLVLGWGVLLIAFKLLLFKAYGSAIYKGGMPPLLTTLSAIWDAYVPIPDLTQKVRFWWTNIIPFQVAYPPDYHFAFSDMTWSWALSLLLSLLLLLVVISKFRKNPLVLTVFLVNTVVYGIYTVVVLKAYTSRYLGLQFITLIYCYWFSLSAGEPCRIELINRMLGCLNRGRINRMLNHCERYFKQMMYFILISGVFASCVAFYKEAKYPFSFSRRAADYIKSVNLLQDHALVGYPDYAAQCISAHLDKPIYYPQIGRESYYSGCLEKNFKQILSFPEIISSCLQLIEIGNKKALLIMNFPVMLDREHILVKPQKISEKYSIELLQAITGDVINPDEQFWLYEIAKTSEVHSSSPLK